MNNHFHSSPSASANKGKSGKHPPSGAHYAAASSTHHPHPQRSSVHNANHAVNANVSNNEHDATSTSSTSTSLFSHSTQASRDLEALVRMGFPKDRAEKAIAWTGDIGVAAAVNWILAHKDNPYLNKKEQREYLVYLCPSGPLLEHIHTFLERTAQQCGLNGAHLHLSHITMCHGFKADDSQIPVILKHMRSAYQRIADRLPDKLILDRYASENFIGLFLDNQSERILKEYSQCLIQELQSTSDQDIGQTSKKAFHLTLAYQFAPGDYDAVLNLAKRIDLKAPCHWHFRLYSRDPRFNTHEVYEMAGEWHNNPEVDDLLHFASGDYLYVSPKENETHGSPTGYVYGHSWASGLSGRAPLSHLHKCFDSDVWILHGSIPYNTRGQLDEEDMVSNIEMMHYPPAQRKRWLSVANGSSSGGGGVRGVGTSLSRLTMETATPRRRRSNADSHCTVYVMRHGERMDFVFGWDWIKKCFDTDGNFSRVDLNMPKAVPKRRTGSQAYIRDPPLTAIGLLQAQITGKAMKDAGISFGRIFVSPALRSVQTATAVLESVSCPERRPIKLCVEPGLYEWLGWVKEGHPEWLTAAELHAFGIPVDLDYRPVFEVKQLNYEETTEEYYMRNGLVVKRALEACGHEGGNLLFVAHASSLDTCTRQLVGGAPRNQFDMNKVTQRVPYCAVVTCVQEAVTNSGSHGNHGVNWLLKNPPFPSLTHGGNIRFNAVQTFTGPVDRLNINNS
ncbi:ecdysteroid-phosphate phosphatase-like [Paramacrobiotus metropolitanus]|uniref:ecdysteroid-phosphate phosphatase-like n=1 Tax=Paramacrobiotus metropolitanus TaxID=2943436 RepID=UPI0024460DC1|nr:ecdysteroid-phosphate phosphatase-like [Paramacrobiotus metropolitanus]